MSTVKCETGQRRRERIRERSSAGRRKKENVLGGLGRDGGSKGISEIERCLRDDRESDSGFSRVSDMSSCSTCFRSVLGRN